MKKKKFDSKKFMVGFIAFIMVFSVFSVIFYGYQSQDPKLKYNGILFTRTNNQWTAKIDGKLLSFDYYPEEVDYIEVDPTITDKLKATPQMDLTSDPESDFKDTIALVEYQFSNILDDNLDKYTRITFTKENEFYIPIITCEDATANLPVIYFTISNTTAISLVDNCIIVEARNEPDFVRLKDRLLYSIFDIIG